MKITALVENKATSGAKAVHGLSLYIETPKHNILFDFGPDDTLFQNCQTLGVDLAGVDIAILSHGHWDHGGALEKFLQVNKTAKLYAQAKAFEKHYAKVLFLKKEVGISPALRANARIVALDGDTAIDDELALFTTPRIDKYYSNANRPLYSEAGKDDFSHEQNLVIFGERNVLVTGCGHAGIVNIMEKAAQYAPAVCVGGYHLFNPTTQKTVPAALIDGIAGELGRYDTHYYTCHCTGQEAFERLARQMPNMHYLACGETIDV